MCCPHQDVARTQRAHLLNAPIRHSTHMAEPPERIHIPTPRAPAVPRNDFRFTSRAQLRRGDPQAVEQGLVPRQGRQLPCRSRNRIGAGGSPVIPAGSLGNGLEDAVNEKLAPPRASAPSSRAGPRRARSSPWPTHSRVDRAPAAPARACSRPASSLRSTSCHCIAGSLILNDGRTPLFRRSGPSKVVLVGLDHRDAGRASAASDGRASSRRRPGTPPRRSTARSSPPGSTTRSISLERLVPEAGSGFSGSQPRRPVRA